MNGQVSLEIDRLELLIKQIHDRSRGLLMKVRQQHRGQPDGSEEVRHDCRFGHTKVEWIGQRVFGCHDPGVVDQDVERWVFRRDASRKGGDRRRVAHISTMEAMPGFAATTSWSYSAPRRATMTMFPD